MSIILDLFLTFFKIGLFSIGGGYAIIPLIQEQVVEKTGWISEKVFTDIITISQMTPGPLAVNTSTFAGLQIAGVAGAITATLGCVFCGVLSALMLYRFFRRHQESIYVFEVLGGLKAASLGLIISAAATILMLAFWGTSTPAFNSTPDWFIIVMFALSLLVLRIWKINPIIVMLGAGLAGIIIY